MRPVIGAIALGALVVGGAVVLATSRHTSTAEASLAQTPVPAATTAPVPVPVASAPAARSEAVPVAQTVTTRAPHRTAPVRTRYVQQTRSGMHSAEIIGGSAVGGALIGGLVGGKKGAIIGGLVGGGAGTVYDRKTRHKVRPVQE